MGEARMQSRKLYRGAIFDLDGTLLDTETCAQVVIGGLLKGYRKELGMSISDVLGKAEQDYSEDTGLWTHADHVNIIGMRGVDWANFVLKAKHMHGKIPWERLTSEWEEGLTRVYDKYAFPLRGVMSVTETLERMQVPMGIATSSSKLSVGGKRNVPGNAQLFERFPTIVTGDEVTNGKPHPEIFQLAASKLSIAATDCVAFEDSVLGCESAQAAGCFVVAVPEASMSDELVRERFTGKADLVLRSLESFECEQFFPPRS